MIIAEQITKKPQLLDSTSFFDVFTTQEKELIYRILERKTFEEGNLIFSESQPASSIFILEEGSVTLTIPGSHTLFVGEGDIFGEIAVINETARLGKARARSRAVVLELNTQALYNAEIIPSIIALKITKLIAKKHSVLSLRRKDICTKDIIRQGTSGHIEFKAKLRFNREIQNMDTSVEFDVLKTVAAFLNTLGGTLLVGVTDNSEIVGLEKDGFANEDQLRLHFTNLLKDKLGEQTLGLVCFEIIQINDKKILRVEVSKSNTAVFMRHENNEYFFIRSGTSTVNLNFSEFYKYNEKHF